MTQNTLPVVPRQVLPYDDTLSDCGGSAYNDGSSALASFEQTHQAAVADCSGELYPRRPASSYDSYSYDSGSDAPGGAFGLF